MLLKAPEPLRLFAEDADGLTVIAAHLQDALTIPSDLTYLPRRRRFIGVFNRFMWQEAEGAEGLTDAGGKPYWRIQSALEFDGVLQVKSQNMPDDAPRMPLELLTVSFEPTAPEDEEDPAGTVVLVFAAGPAIRLDVECLAVYMRDYGKPWSSANRPRHRLDDPQG